MVGKSHPVLGALDLGGSSTQISLHVGQKGGSTVGQSDFFVHSYLGYGVEKMLEKYRASLRLVPLAPSTRPFTHPRKHALARSTKNVKQSNHSSKHGTSRDLPLNPPN